MTIDWAFIAGLEGGDVLNGYVPSENSGVTIAAGVDLGASDPKIFAVLPITLLTRVQPYFGKRGQQARDTLAAYPLKITVVEANLLDQAAESATVNDLTQHYDAALTVGAFKQLIPAAQTVLTSVSYQYGSVWARCPHFWARCLAQDYLGMIHELENFGDAFPSRRKKEAAYLQGALP